MIIRAWLYIAALAAVVAVGQADEPVPPSQPPKDATPAYRRLLLPQDRIEAWLRDSATKYLPVTRDDFERVAEIVKNHPLQKDVAAGTRVVSGRFSGRLGEDKTFAGQGRLQIEHTHYAPSLLPLTPWSVAVREGEVAGVGRCLAHWLGSPPRRAACGAAEDGRVQVLVERSGELAFDWSLRGRQGTHGSVVFLIALPACTMRTMELDLPRDLTPQIDRGTIEADGASGDERKRWRVRLGAGVATLTLVPETHEPATPDVTLKQSLTYRLWPHGVDVHAEWTLDVRDAPLRHLEVALDPNLDLLAVEDGNGQRIHWQPQEPQSLRSVRLQFPTPLTGPRKVLRLDATLPLKLGQSATLPKLQPSGVFWQEGVARIWVEKSLTLDRLVTRKCRQSSRLSREPFERFVGEQCDVQLFAADAAMDVLISHGRQRFLVDSGTAVALGTSDVRGQTIAEFSGLEGSSFLLSAEVGPQWTIDYVSVESGPIDALESWEVRPGKPAKLEVRLAKPLGTSEKLRLKIVGQRLDAPQGPALPRNRPLRLDDVEMVRFDEPAWRRRLVEVDAEALPATPLHITRLENVRRLDPAKVSAAELELFEDPPTGILLDVLAAPARCELAFSTQKDNLRANWSVDILATANTVQEEYALQCSPGGTPLDKLEVRFSQPRTADLKWSLDGEEDGQITAQRSAAEGEVWQIRLRPRTSRFTLRASRTTPGTDSLPLSLPLLLGAARQEGRLLVRAAPRVNVGIEQRGLTPLLLSAENAPAGLRAAFQFDPLRDAIPGLQSPAIRLSRESESVAVSGPIVWQMALDSWYEPSGRTRHEAILDVERGETDALSLRLPADAEQIEVRVADQHVALRDAGSEQLRVPLAGNSRRLSVRLAFQLSGSPLGFLTSVDAPFPQFEHPVVRRRWSVHVPATYHVASNDPAWRFEQPADSPGWSSRLLGPLARAPGQARFNPFSLADWRSFLGKGSSVSAVTLATPSAMRDGSPPAAATPDREGSLRPALPAGWLVYRHDGSPSHAASVSIAHLVPIEALGWALIPLAALLMLSFGGRNFYVTLTVAMILVFVALVVPSRFVPVTSGVVLGTTAGAVLALLRRAGANSIRGTLNQLPSSVSRVSITVVAALSLGGVVRFGMAQTPAEKDTRPAVVIPLSQDGTPLRSAVYHVPETVWQGLEQRVAEVMRHPRGYLIESASYTAELAPPPGTDVPYPVAILANYRIRTFTAAQPVRLDFGAPQAGPLPADAVLDGRVTPLRWEDQGRFAAITIAEAGPHGLEISFRRLAEFHGIAWRVDQLIPKVANAELSIALPSAKSLLADVSSALGAVSQSGKGRVLHAELGPTDRIFLTWRDKAQAAEAPVVEVDELLWFSIKPGAVSLKAKWICQSPRGAVRRLRLLVDHPLRLRGNLRTGDQVDIKLESESSLVGAGDSQISWMVLDRPRSGQFAIEGEFLLHDTLGVGALRLPQIAMLDVPGIRRRVAISVDPELELDEIARPDTQRITPGEFLAHWGGGAEKPKVARVLNVPTACTVTTRFREPRRQVRETLTTSLSPGRADMTYTGEATISGLCFQHHLRLPPGLVVDRVSVTEGNQRRDLRWSIAPGGIATVFLQERAGPAQRLELSGRMALGQSGTWTPPAIRWEEAEVQASVLRVFRQPGVRVEASKAPLTSVAADPGERDLGRFLGQFSLAEKQPATFKFQPNVRGPATPAFLCAVWKDGSRWKLDVVCEVQVGGGLLDYLTFDAPVTLGGPFDVQPPGQVEVQAISGQSRAIWRYVPSAPLEGKQPFRLRVELPKSPGEWTEFPIVRPLDLKAAERLVALPDASGGLEGTWETEGLVRAGRLDKTRPPYNDVYRLAGDVEQVHARLRPAEVMGEPRVRLAEVNVEVRYGVYSGTARFELEPSGLAECQIVVPPGVQILQASVEGLPTLIEREGDDRLRVQLHSRKLPQVVSVVFSGDCSRHTGGSPLAAPRVAGIPVTQTLWTVRALEESEIALPRGASLKNATEAEWLRLQAGAEAIKQAAERWSAETLRDWYRPRVTRWLAQAARLEQTVAKSEASRDGVVLQKITALKKEQAELARKLGLSEVLTAAKSARSDGETAASAPSEFASQTNAGRSFLTTNSAAAPIAQNRGPEPATVWPGGLLAVLVFGGVLVLRNTAAGQRTLRLPHWLVILLGLAWWLWLWPSALGVVLMVGGAALFIHGSRRSHSVPPQRGARGSTSSASK